MTDVFARKALLAKGWTDSVRLTIRAGRIAGIASGVGRAAADVAVGYVVPGICNAHSHAFQRALVGRSERRSAAGGDNFWSWRTNMYALANRLDADALAAIAAETYVEMLESGYTSVAEFHYLHDRPSDDGDAMFSALAAAAATAGIRLNYVPVFYQRAAFDAPQPSAQQRRFVISLDEFLQHRQRAARQSSATVSVAIGAHSLRAVDRDALAAIAASARDTGAALHLHIAEQQGEVEQCLAAYGQRPVAWLLDNHAVDERWCLVHATHVDAAEVRRLAASGAVVCLCPSTEANLGDGVFPLASFLEHGGCIAIGSDSQVTIDPFEELRWLEYGQRLASRTRNTTGHLYQRVLQGGALTGAGIPPALTEGAAADLLTLDADDPMLLGHDDDTLIDALIYSGLRLPIDRVMVHGDWRVIGGRHVNGQPVREAYRAALGRVL